MGNLLGLPNFFSVVGVLLGLPNLSVTFVSFGRKSTTSGFWWCTLLVVVFRGEKPQEKRTNRMTEKMTEKTWGKLPDDLQWYCSQNGVEVMRTVGAIVSEKTAEGRAYALTHLLRLMGQV